MIFVEILLRRSWMRMNIYLRSSQRGRSIYFATPSEIGSKLSIPSVHHRLGPLHFFLCAQTFQHEGKFLLPSTLTAPLFLQAPLGPIQALFHLPCPPIPTPHKKAVLTASIVTVTPKLVHSSVLQSLQLSLPCVLRARQNPPNLKIATNKVEA
jgi:hypothetical protein